MNKVFITKADGAKELFDSKKLHDSLTRAKASPEVASEIVAHVGKEVRDGMSTRDIYDHAYALLRERQRPQAMRYSLRRSLMELGPSGFPFEKFIGEIFRKKGYSVEVDKIVQGSCVEHEVDVIAWNDRELIMSEAKFHNQAGIKSDLKVVLYIKARVDDLKKAAFDFGGAGRVLTDGWLITNTKFTVSAIKYAACAGLTIVGWNYPLKGNLQDLIEESGLHPLTCLTTLSDSEKKGLMESGVVLCSSLRDDSNSLKTLGMKDERIITVIEEANLLCPA